MLLYICLKKKKHVKRRKATWGWFETNCKASWLSFIGICYGLSFIRICYSQLWQRYVAGMRKMRSMNRIIVSRPGKKKKTWDGGIDGRIILKWILKNCGVWRLCMNPAKDRVRLWLWWSTFGCQTTQNLLTICETVSIVITSLLICVG